MKSESSIFYLLCFFSSSSSSTHIPPLFLSPFISIYFSLSSSIRRTPHGRILMLNIRNILRRKMKNNEIATFPKHQKSKKNKLFLCNPFSSITPIFFCLFFLLFILLYPSHSPSMKFDAKYSQFHLQNNNNNNKSEPSIFLSALSSI